jgi:repressor LexA
MRDVRLGGLTRRQLEAYQFIERFVAARGYSPTFEEIRAALGLRSKSGIGRLVNGLTQRGFITLIPGRKRSIALKPAPEAP